jgi:DNA-binding transcriptional MerR regulator
LNSGLQDRTWTIRALADELRVTTRSLRLYEAQGLIAPERRGRVRVYHSRDYARSRLILRGKRFGLSLAEIGELGDIYDGAAPSERRPLEALLARVNQIEQDLEQREHDVRLMLLEVERLIGQCQTQLRARPAQHASPLLEVGLVGPGH